MKTPGTPSLAKRAETAILHAVAYSADLVAGIFAGFIAMVPASWSIIFIAGIGAGLVLLRDAFMALIPAMLKSVSAVRDIVNTIITVLDGVIDVCRIAFDAIETVVSAIEAAVLMSKHKHKFNGFADTNPVMHYVTDKEVRQFLNRIEHTCKSYDSLPAIWNRVVKETLSPSVCPVIRATYPLGPTTIYPATNAVLGWMSYDACPYPKNNCESNAAAPDWVCVGKCAAAVATETGFINTTTPCQLGSNAYPCGRLGGRLSCLGNHLAHTYRRHFLDSGRRPVTKIGRRRLQAYRRSAPLLAAGAAHHLR